MIQELFKESADIGHLTDAAFTYIKDFAKDIADKGKDYSDNEKELGSCIIIADICRFWFKFKDMEDNKIKDIMTTIAVNGTMRGYQYYNYSMMAGENDEGRIKEAGSDK